MFLAAGALLALIAAISFSGSGTSSTIRPSPALNAGSFPEPAVPSVSPDAAARPSASSTPAFNLDAKSAAIGDLRAGDLLYGFNADARWPVASLTKLMTAALVLELFPADAVITLVPEDFSSGGALTASLQPGDKYRASDLLKVLLVPSSNEAAEAFARAYGRSAFTAAMNAKAASWGLTNTHFADPSGISVANQSTPREFLKLLREVYAAHPEVFVITRERNVSARELLTGAVKYFPTTNSFAGRAGFLGGKTGTTPEAGDNLASIFDTGGTPVAVVVFGAADRYAATESLLQLIQ